MSQITDCKLEYPLTSEFKLAGRVHILASGELSPELILSPFLLVLQAVEKQMTAEGLPFDIGLSINAFFSEKEEFTLRLLPEEKAITAKLVFYPLPRLSPYYGSKTLYMILAEELCHAIWNIHDETLVSFKVFEVLLHIFPDLEIREIYSQEIAAQHRKWVEDHPPACPS